MHQDGVLARPKHGTATDVFDETVSVEHEARKRSTGPTDAGTAHCAVDRRLPLARQRDPETNPPWTIIGFELVSGRSDTKRDLQGVAKALGIEIQLGSQRINLNGLSLSEVSVHANPAVARDIGASLRLIDAQVKVSLNACG